MKSGLGVTADREEPEFPGLGGKDVPLVWGKHGDQVALELVK